jgi:hypothetical protein
MILLTQRKARDLLKMRRRRMLSQQKLTKKDPQTSRRISLKKQTRRRTSL